MEIDFRDTRKRLAHRADAFEFIAKSLWALQRPISIVETGCARQADNWEGDGQSTLVWEWLINFCGGTGISFDISPVSTAYARTQVKKMQIEQIDSVTGLRSIANPQAIDFLYLDSFDLTETNESAIHHLAELTSVYARLRSGCIIAVDDCFSDTKGKHLAVAAFLNWLGVQPVLRSYVTVWVKP